MSASNFNPPPNYGRLTLEILCIPLVQILVLTRGVNAPRPYGFAFGEFNSALDETN
ncbi:hypothetical protein ACFL6B_01540 [Thermodesulfobacteriota bacterium]